MTWIAAAAALLAVRGFLALRYPMINDVTTTPGAPPRFRAAARLPANAGRDMGYPAAFSAAQRRAYPDLAPRHYAREPEAVFRAMAAAARALPGWELAAEDAAEGVLEATAVTRLLRYRDDFVAELRPEPGGCAVHARSKSRLGRGDFGANAKRIRAFLAAVDVRLT